MKFLPRSISVFVLIGNRSVKQNMKQKNVSYKFFLSKCSIKKRLNYLFCKGDQQKTNGNFG